MIHAGQTHGATSRKEHEYLEGWRRERAELANFRQRVQQQTVAARHHHLRELALPLLAVADNFQAIVAHVPEAQKSDAWTQGVLHVARQMEQALLELGLRPIDAVGKPFNPLQHEAVGHVEDAQYESGIVIEIVQPGYVAGDEVIRPAKVKIAA